MHDPILALLCQELKKDCKSKPEAFETSVHSLTLCSLQNRMQVFEDTRVWMI